MGKVLPLKYFQNKDTVKIAKNLLGKFLLRRLRVGVRAYIITEVEAYDGFRDKASHAHRGKTERNKIMFGPAGHWYVYFTYGMHWMLNIVTGPKEYPAAILIRGIEADSRGFKKSRSGYTRINGPARLTKFLGIDKKFNGKPASLKSGLWIAAPTKSERASLRLKIGAGGFKIKSAPRVGVAYAGPFWSKKKWRFYVKV